jgi:hypothetical protein
MTAHIIQALFRQEHSQTNLTILKVASSGCPKGVMGGSCDILVVASTFGLEMYNKAYYDRTFWCS